MEIRNNIVELKDVSLNNVTRIDFCNRPMSYINGNYIVYRSYDRLRKRAFRVGEDLVASFPDSIDIKITNKCNFGCPFCHENSVSTGEEFDLEETIKKLDSLPNVSIEVAIGGGDIFTMEEDKLVKFLTYLLNKNMLPRITINYQNLKNEENLKLLKKLLSMENFKRIAIGISIKSYSEFKDVNIIFSREKIDCQKVFHVIAGLIDVSELEKIVDIRKKYRNHERLTVGYDDLVGKDDEVFKVDAYSRILILGYKQWGRAKESTLPVEKLDELSKYIESLLNRSRREGSNIIIGFDNLAIEQLNIKSMLSNKYWDCLYLGEEGSHSMYIDAVKGEYSRTSRTPERESWNNIGLIDYFKSLRNV